MLDYLHITCCIYSLHCCCFVFPVFEQLLIMLIFDDCCICGLTVLLLLVFLSFYLCHVNKIAIIMLIMSCTPRLARVV